MPTPSLSHKAAAVLIGTAALSLLASGTAFAYWTTTGTGTGAASAGTAQGVSVTATTATSLYPGASAPATLLFSNPNPFPVTVTSLVPTASPTVTGGLDNAACATSSGVTFATLSGSWTIPAQGTAAGTIEPAPQVAAAVAMSNASASGCQGATFSTTYTFTGQSAS